MPAVEPVVSAWRERFDGSAAQGVPAHITVLYPFLPEHRLTDDVLAHLGGVCGELGTLDVTFARTGRFPGVLFLDPEPADGLRNLTAAIADRWPEAPPYGGSHGGVVPHLTVACADEDGVLDAAHRGTGRGAVVRLRRCVVASTGGPAVSRLMQRGVAGWIGERCRSPA